MQIYIKILYNEAAELGSQHIIRLGPALYKCKFNALSLITLQYNVFS